MLTRRTFLGVGLGAAAALVARPVLSCEALLGPPSGVTVTLHLAGGGTYRFTDLPIVQDAVDAALWRIPDCRLEADQTLAIARITGTVPGQALGLTDPTDAAREVDFPMLRHHGSITLVAGDSLTVTNLSVRVVGDPHGVVR